MKRKIIKLLSLVLSAALVLAFMPASVTAEGTQNVNSATTLSDGNYTPEAFTFSGGTGKVKITCPVVKVKDGKSTATLVFSSRYYTRLQTGGSTYNSVVDATADTSTFEIPVALNTDQAVAGTTTAMSSAHDVDYTIRVSLTVPELDSSTAAVDNTTSIADARYKPDSFTFSGGTGKVKLTCPQIEVRGGGAYATIVFSSPYFTKLKTNGRVYSAVNDTAAGTSTFVIPIRVNSSYNIIGTTTAMSAAHDVTYTIEAGLSSSSVKISSTTTEKTDKPKKTKEKVKVVRKKLKDGTYKVRTEVTGKMFYIYPKDASRHYSIVTVKNGKITAVVTLDGQGYDYVYMGTKSQADKAARSTWSRYSEKNGFYSYKIKVAKFDKKLNISGHSHKYDQWFGERTIIFYSGTAKKVRAGATTTGNKKNKVAKRTGKGKVVSSKKTTATVNNSTSLKDGVYTPDQFSWSGGSGRLAYIKCTKIRVSGGRAYATIVFSSSSYDRLKASGHVYSKSGGGLSTFVVPVRLNTNNTIIGRTTAMSQAHWVEYYIYPYVAKASGSSSKSSTRASTGKMTKKAPAITGLTARSAVKVENAKYFKIYNYEKGVKLIEVNIADGTGLKVSSKAASDANEVEYDEEGNPIARSQHEITQEIYQNKVVNYLLVPSGVQVPAGLDKSYIIIKTPARSTYAASKQALAFVEALGSSGNISLSGIKDSKIRYAGSYEDPSYQMFVMNKTGLAVLPSSVLPEKIQKPDNFFQWIISLFTRGRQEREQNAQNKKLKGIEKSYTALGIPVLIDRSADESSRLASAEWVKVYGAIYGCEKAADKIYEKDVKDEKTK